MQPSQFAGLNKTLNRRNVQWSLLLILLLLCTGFSANDDQSKKIDVLIKKVVYETEEGYVLTDKGSFLLPNPSTEIAMEATAFDGLIANLKRAIGKQSTVYVYDNVVVAISSENAGINFKPEYKKRQKKIYTSPPIKITTTMQRWEADSYRLSIKTLDGVFCIFNTFVVKDYHEKVHQKLKTCCKMGADLEVKLTIKYHKNEGSYECPGEIEDIELL